MPTRYTYRITPVPYIRTHLLPDPAHARRYTPDGRAQRLSAALEAVFNLAIVVFMHSCLMGPQSNVPKS